MKKKGNERKGCQNIAQNLCGHTVNGQTKKCKIWHFFAIDNNFAF